MSSLPSSDEARESRHFRTVAENSGVHIIGLISGSVASAGASALVFCRWKKVGVLDEFLGTGEVRGVSAVVGSSIESPRAVHVLR